MTLRDFRFKRYWKVLLPLVALVLLVNGAAAICGVSIKGLKAGLLNAWNFINHMFPPDLSVLPDLLRPAFDSIIIAFLATIAGTALSLVFAIAAASNISHKWLRNTTRFLIGVERSLPEIIISLLLVAAFGLGTFVGVMALTIGCIGMLGKLLADLIEEIDNSSIESLEAIGGSKLQVILFGVLPQIMPNLLSYALFRFEINIRLAVILGAVGAGGIGLELEHSFDMMQYHQGFTALLIILLMVFATERLSNFFRKKLRVEGLLT